MSWNKYCIVVINIEETDLIKAVELTGYGKMLTPSSEIDFRTAFDNRGEEMPFGLIDNSLWILSPTQVEKFFSDEQSVLEKNLIKNFPNSTILALEENSTVDSFGFSLIQFGKRIRILSGCDGEINFEYGNLIDEEVNCYKQVLIDFDDEDKKVIIESEGVEGFENHLLFEAKWRVPFELFTNKYGKSIDTVYEENKLFRNFKYERK